MKPAFDTNQWYTVLMNNDTGKALVGTSLFRNNKQGSTFIQPANDTKPQQKWQFYAIDTGGTYVMRTKDAGRNGFMGAYYNQTSDDTVAYMLRIDSNPGDTIYWTLQSSNDAGTYFLYSKANGTSSRLTIKGTSTFMTTSEGESNPQQQFSFEPAGAINDGDFSTVDLQSTLLSTPATSSTSIRIPPSTTSQTKTTESTSTGTNTPATASASGGLSKGAKAAIGASIGGVALVALVVISLFFLKKRRTQQPSYQPTRPEADDNLGIFAKPELGVDEEQKKHADQHELDSQYAQQYELDGHDNATLHAMPELATNTHASLVELSRPSELPPETLGRPQGR